MVATVLDVENSVRWYMDGKKWRVDGGPYCKDNRLVSVGWATEDTDWKIEYAFFHHKDFKEDPSFNVTRLKEVLAKTTLFVAHNAKHDLNWLYESGFEYSGDFWDTMLGEYCLARGLKVGMGLAESAVRRKVAHKKSELIDEYWRKRIGFDSIPIPVVTEYGTADIQSTVELFQVQRKLYDEPANRILRPTFRMMNKFLPVLASMERHGSKIDEAALDKVEQEYIEERKAILLDLNKIKDQVMGDTPINLGSPEQLSQLIYSRKVIDKVDWAKTFNLGKNDAGKDLYRTRMNSAKFAETVRSKTIMVRKTKASQCPACKGTGKYYKTKKNGDNFARPTNCPTCSGEGIVYAALPEYAGLKLSPINYEYTAIGGFSTDKETLGVLASLTKDERARRFLIGMVRVNAIDTYLASFIGGIRRGIRGGILHTSFNQAVTSTGRLSSSDPNCQNMPRGKTFPVKRAFVSRWSGGLIGDADFGQLEFKVAADISRCPVMMKEIADGVDVHAFTSKVLTEAGQPTDRQDSKSRTFRPLYGGVSGSPAEMAYNKAFMKKYVGLAKWHLALQDEAIQHKFITIPSGRQFAFPYASRTKYGGSTSATKIKNYPVQAFATADIVPLACIMAYNLIVARRLKSILILTVHDSIVVDIYPGEEQAITDIMYYVIQNVYRAVKEWYDYDMIVPLTGEVKIGPNWLDGEKVALAA